MGRDVRPAFWRPVEGKPGAVRLGELSAVELEDLAVRAIARKRPASLPRPVIEAKLLGTPKFERVASVHDLGGWLPFLAPHFDAAGAVNLTGTYSPRYSAVAAMSAAPNVVADFRRGLECFLRRDLVEPWCIGVEWAPQGKLGGRPTLHFHAMVGGTWSTDAVAALEAYFTSTRGWAKAKLVSDCGGCVKYCAKHLTKAHGTASEHFEFSLGWQSRPGSRHARRVAKSVCSDADAAVCRGVRQGSHNGSSATPERA